MCPLGGRVNYSFVSTDDEGQGLKADALAAAAEGAASKSLVELQLVQLEAELAGVGAKHLKVWGLPLNQGRSLPRRLDLAQLDAPPYF